MRKLIFAAAVSALAITPALADFGDIIRSWEIRGRGLCRGVAWDGEYIWCQVPYTGSPDMMYRCLPSNGSVVSSFETVFGLYISGRGICYRLWDGRPSIEVAVSDSVSKEYYLYRYTFNGSVVDRMRVWVPAGVGFSSVYFDNKNDWISNPEETGSEVFKLDNEGHPISSFTLNKPGDTSGITKQADFFWFTMSLYGGFHGACKSRANGSIVASFETYEIPFDCTYENKHLWVSSSNTVYCYDVSNAPAVAPASVGRVKALFR